MIDADRYVDLWLSGFPDDPQDVAALFPLSPNLVARKGEPTAKSRRAAPRNLVVFRHVFRHEDTWALAIEALISSLGGWERIGEILIGLPGAEQIIQFTLPIRNSPHQENNFVEAKTLERLARYNIDLGMEFSTYLSNENPPA